MEWTQFAIFFIGVFGLFIWNRAEARTDARHMDAKLEGQRNLMDSIHQEMKDFHCRLYSIERERAWTHAQDSMNKKPSESI